MDRLISRQFLEETHAFYNHLVSLRELLSQGREPLESDTMAELPAQLSLEKMAVADAGDECCICLRPFSEPLTSTATEDDNADAEATGALQNLTIAEEISNVEAGIEEGTGEEVIAAETIQEEVVEVAVIEAEPAVTGSEARNQMLNRVMVASHDWRSEEMYWQPEAFMAIIRLNDSDGRISPIGRSIGEQVIRALRNGPPQDSENGRVSNHPHFLAWNTTMQRFEGHAPIDWPALNELISARVVENAIEDLTYSLTRNNLNIHFVQEDAVEGRPHDIIYPTSAEASEIALRMDHLNTRDENSRWFAWAGRVEVLVTLERVAVLRAQEDDHRPRWTRPPLWHDGTRDLRAVTTDLDVLRTEGHELFARRQEERRGWWFSLMRHVTQHSTSEVVYRTVPRIMPEPAEAEPVEEWNNDGDCCHNPVKVTSGGCECKYTVGILCLKQQFRQSSRCLYCRRIVPWGNYTSHHVHVGDHNNEERVGIIVRDILPPDNNDNEEDAIPPLSPSPMQMDIINHGGNEDGEEESRL